MSAKTRTSRFHPVVGRRPRRADYAAGRDAARRERAKLAAARAAAEAALRQRSGTRLSQWPRLDGAELDLLLDLIEAARRSGPGHEAVTEDGRWRVRLGDPADPADVATLIGPDGRLAAELFELDPTGYDNLTELLKQLRRPKLGERLNPRELERTLRDALPRLAANEVTQLAEGWDRLEELRRSVEQTETAATAVARFTRGPWRRWAQIVVRRRSDALASATTRLDNTTKQRRRAEEELAAARHDVKVTEAELGESKELLGDRRAELRELVDSSAYQTADRPRSRAGACPRHCGGTAATAAALDAPQAPDRR